MHAGRRVGGRRSSSQPPGDPAVAGSGALIVRERAGQIGRTSRQPDAG